jgi:tryptophanyl-tRNA synthetase
MKKAVLVSGIQPTGRLHLGNYLGALKNFVSLQNSNKYECLFFVADLHSLTEEFTPKEKTKQITELVADFLAAGLNPKKSTIFLQSAISAHSELAWILNTITPMGELRRMTQFKDKSGEQETANVGLFTYPTLMAADIILYDAKFVPVGDDQLQHLELARTLVRKFNAKFGKMFIEPQPILTQAPRIMSLDDPNKKMSKSRPAGCIFLDDSPEEIHKKVMRATTDSESVIRYDAQAKPGISNLLRIYSSLSGELIPDLEKRFAGMNYSELKIGLSNLISDYFAKFRENKKAILKNKKLISSSVASGNKKSAKIATAKIAKIKTKLGLI